MVKRRVRRGRKPLATLTPEEDRIWSKYFEFYVDDYGASDDEAGHLAWRDLVSEFPRLKRYRGAKP